MNYLNWFMVKEDKKSHARVYEYNVGNKVLKSECDNSNSNV